MLYAPEIINGKYFLLITYAASAPHKVEKFPGGGRRITEGGTQPMLTILLADRILTDSKRAQLIQRKRKAGILGISKTFKEIKL